MWTRIQCSRCRNTFASGTAFLAHTHTAGDGAVIQGTLWHRVDTDACKAAAIDADSSIHAIERTTSRKGLHRVPMHGLGRTVSRLRRSDKIT